MKVAADNGLDNGLDIIEDNDGDIDTALDDAGTQGKDEAPEDRGDSFEPTAPVDTPKLPEPDTSERNAARIPKARFDEVNNKLKEATAELEALKSALPAPAAAAAPKALTAPAAPPDQEIKAIRKQYMNALMEGDTDKAEELSAQIDEAVIAVAQSRFEANSAAKAAATSIAAESAQAVQDYPWLDDPEHADALDAICASRDRRIASGVPPVQALREAVAAIAPKFAPSGTLPPPRGVKEKADDRPSAAVRRGAEDSTLQPPALKQGQGSRTTADRSMDPSKMTEAQFEALTDTEKKHLRGDL